MKDQNGKAARMLDTSETAQKNSRSHSIKPAQFFGTSNPRWLRIISSLLARPQLRESVDSVAGASNGPDAIMQIRDLFSDGHGKDKHLICTRIKFTDRDGRLCCPGVYSFSTSGRRHVLAWLSKRTQLGAS